MNAAILAKAQDGSKFTAADVTPELSREAGAFIREYTGTFAFLVSVKETVMATRKWKSAEQVKGVLNCMVSEVRRGLATQQAPAAVTGPAPQAAGPVNGMAAEVRDGTYTVMLTGDTNRTIRVEAGEFKDGTPVQWVAFLSGSDNNRDYTTCGYIIRGSFRWTRRYSDTAGALAEAVMVLVSVNADQQATFGKTWAMESGNCWICGRTLTTPASIHYGYGPTCAERNGLEWNRLAGREDPSDRQETVNSAENGMIGLSLTTSSHPSRADSIPSPTCSGSVTHAIERRRVKNVADTATDQSVATMDEEPCLPTTKTPVNVSPALQVEKVSQTQFEKRLEIHSNADGLTAAAGQSTTSQVASAVGILSRSDGNQGMHGKDKAGPAVKVRKPRRSAKAKAAAMTHPTAPRDYDTFKNWLDASPAGIGLN